ncbi:acetyltransferase [Psychroserpens jangbogonensis]|uniref:acetyltransferase n=1 Tax=Psychroserpens jangbogonensis TaxID=1484460 RepID=UPI00053EE334|nr:acetyltransferase [Psychroserpens jangbogonensis]
MIIIGAKGYAKEVLEVVVSDLKADNIAFFDNVTNPCPDQLYDKYKILRSENEAKTFIKKTEDKDVVIGVGLPIIRKKMYDFFSNLGANPKTIIAKDTSIGSFDVSIGNGTTIMQGVRITNSVNVGKACLINLNCTIGHDTTIGDFVELSPNVNISGRCEIGDLTSIGTNAIIIPDITIGRNCIIGAGTLVIKDVPDNSVVVGVPGKIIKTNE